MCSKREEKYPLPERLSSILEMTSKKEKKYLRSAAAIKERSDLRSEASFKAGAVVRSSSQPEMHKSEK